MIKKITFFNIIKRILPIAYSSAPYYLVMTFIVAILHGLSHSFITIMVQKLFDSITSALNFDLPIQRVLISISLLAVALVFNQVFNGLHNVMSEDLGNRIIRKMGSLLHLKASRLDTLFFEDKSNLDAIKKAQDGVMNSSFFLFIVFTIFTYYVPYILTMGIYLYTLKPILSVSILLIFIPVTLNQFMRTKVFSKLANDSAPLKREYEHYEECIVDRRYFKETRTLGVVNYFKHKYINTLKLHNEKLWTAEKRTGFSELGMKSITLLGYLGVLFLFVNSLLSGEISVGAFFAVFMSIDMMFKVMEEMISVHIGRLSKNIGTVRNFIDFLEIEEPSRNIKLECELPSIDLVDVSFKYPNSEKLVLNKINLSIQSGETIAIVGENGAGKSTLVKVIAGLYPSTEGKVKYCGLDITNIKKSSLYSNVSAVFQKYQRYELSLADNIMISDMNKSDKLDTKNISYSLEKANLLLTKKFANSYNTILSREFGGIELSGGEWQKVAIARGIYKDYNLIVLDEPTSAIDPLEETRIYNTFSKLALNKTAIIVTHRLGSTKLADRILVVHDGEIIESGTHEELIRNKGKYADMYNLQSCIYNLT